MSFCGYFDYNATTPLSAAAKAAWFAAVEEFWHNPSSLYRSAAAARAKLESARERCADMLGCEPHQIIFTSGATESNNSIMNFAALRFPSMEIGISALEHPSVREPGLAAAGERLLTIHAKADGTVDLPHLRTLLQSAQFSVISVLAASNETGVLQPWQEIAAMCREEEVYYHCDAAQWIGKLPSTGLGKCDFLTGSAHKLGGPKGVGFLKVPSNVAAFHAQRGGPQEERRRAGTENLPGILSMMAAWQERESCVESAARAGVAARIAFERQIVHSIRGTQIIAPVSPRLWNTVMLVMPEQPNVKWVARLSDLGFQVSTGSACSSGSGASEVLHAMGHSGDALRRVLRVSSGWNTQREDWTALAAAMTHVWADFSSGVQARPQIILEKSGMNQNPGLRGKKNG